MRVLITGATGFLGSHLCRRLVSAGLRVRILCRATSALGDLAGLDLERVTGDITNAASVRSAASGCEWVFHAAADLNYWRQNPSQQLRVNVEGTRHIAEACHAEGVNRLLHVSSVGAIGIPRDAQPANEEFRFNLESTGLVYHLSKRRAEEEVLAVVAKGLHAVTVNPASIQSPRRTRELLLKARHSRVMSYFLGGNCVVHVDDVVTGVLAAMERGESGQRYILGGDNLTFREQAEKAAGVLGVKRRFVGVPSLVTGLAATVLEPLARLRNRPPKIAHMVHYCANRMQFYDSGTARRDLGYSPRSFDDILREAVRLLPLEARRST